MSGLPVLFILWLLGVEKYMQLTSQGNSGRLYYPQLYDIISVLSHYNHTLASCISSELYCIKIRLWFVYV